MLILVSIDLVKMISFDSSSKNKKYFIFITERVGNKLKVRLVEFFLFQIFYRR
jgi:hypothetical protein